MAVHGCVCLVCVLAMVLIACVPSLPPLVPHPPQESDPNVHSYSSSSVMTFSSDGGGGRPRVYQASSSTRAGPGGVSEH